MTMTMKVTKMMPMTISVHEDATEREGGAHDHDDG